MGVEAQQSGEILGEPDVLIRKLWDPHGTFYIWNLYHEFDVLQVRFRFVTALVTLKQVKISFYHKFYLVYNSVVFSIPEEYTLHLQPYYPM